MPKYLCTVNAQIHIIKEITDTIEREAPEEVPAAEAAETAAQLMEKSWLAHPEHDYKEFYEDIEFKVDDVEEQVE